MAGSKPLTERIESNDGVVNLAAYEAAGGYAQGRGDVRGSDRRVPVFRDRGGDVHGHRFSDGDDRAARSDVGAVVQGYHDGPRPRDPQFSGWFGHCPPR